MYLLSDILKSLSSIGNPRLVHSGFGVWVVWNNKNANTTIHQTLIRFGGQKIIVSTNQSLWFFQGSQVYPALARLLIWARIHPEPVLIQVLPAKILIGESLHELSVSIPNQLKEQKVQPGDSLDVWIHPDLVQQIKTFSGLSTEQRPPAYGMSSLSWHTLMVDPGFSLDADLSWLFFVKPVQDTGNEHYALRWKNFYMRLKGTLDRLGIRYIYQHQLLFFKIDGLALLTTWCRDLLSIIAQVKSEDPNQYWPCLYDALTPNGLAFTDDLPNKVDLDWDCLPPDEPHLPLSAGLLLREDFEITFLNSAGTLKLDSVCRVTSRTTGQTQRPTLEFPVSAVTSAGKELPCFYCGMKSHQLSQCPSRQIFNQDQGVWDKIGSLDHKEFAQAVKKLDQAVGNGNLSTNPDILLAEAPENLFLKAVFEINFPVQHRMIRLVWRCRGKEFPDGLRQLTQPDGEYVWAALENARSRNYAQAERMMQQAVLRTSKNYQPHVLLGFIALETDNQRKAEAHWRDAQNLSYTPLQQAYLLFLKGRLREIQGAYDQAHGLYGEALSFSPKWPEPRYRQGVCITKKGFLDQAWVLFSELMAENPHIFNRILIDHELERGRSFLLTSLSGPWAAAQHNATREQNDLPGLNTKLATWFEDENPFRRDAEERIKHLSETKDVQNYVMFSRTLAAGKNLQKDTDKKIKEAVAAIRIRVRDNIARMRSIYEEICYFPFPRLIRKTNSYYNKGGRILQSISKMDLHNGKTYRQALTQMQEAEDILQKMSKQMKSVKLIRESSLFVLFLCKRFLWLAIFGLLASIVVVPVLLHSIQQSGSVWATEWITDQRWQVQRTVSLIMVVISGTIAAVWTSLGYEKQKRKYLASRQRSK
ncbi:hypothetical protein SAMN05660653_00283 [Desulfonatronum thiosulfatophilum]|uniref:Uncharacterized protein n=1 Tax=Desulfonatronum thiosulfatophilum TaxID=617002 RepID=A0A1G6AA96_9BACT|nr:tetratricopeptide repeat protein [Desulfonatronum thiosulfatophilum]SDB05367.1 hypothetical protein SAMN05660653_00283 [Desulfonatronum thiosulfatophilum]